jgi:hypothetical protein
MVSFGMLCLGLFFGGVTTIYLRQVTDWKNFKQIMASISSSLVAGVVLAFIQFLGKSDMEAIAWYPVGLIIALLWGYCQVAVQQIQHGRSKVGGETAVSKAARQRGLYIGIDILWR